PVPDCRVDLPEVPGGANAPGAEPRIGEREQLAVEARVERTGADQRPEGVHPRFAGHVVVEHEGLELGASRWMVALDKQALGDVAVVDVRTLQSLDELVVRLPGQAEPW